jgi:peptide deformylase
MAIRPILLYPEPVLRVRCQEVETFDDELKRLAADMVATMHNAPGIGLAACQVGDTRRLAVVDLSVGEDPDALLILVNPRIVEEEGRVTETEGCLSLPGVNDRVDRPTRIRLEACDLDGRPFQLEAEDWLARAICHEVDHLDGVLFVDRLKGLRRERARRKLKKLATDPSPEGRREGVLA